MRILAAMPPLLLALSCRSTATRDTSTLGADRDKKSSSQPNDLPDGTKSFDQPPSTGLLDMHGFCGPVAISNVAAMLTNPKLCPSPADLAGECFKGVTPGTSPQSIADALNKRKIGSWEVKSLRSVKDPIAEISSLMDNGFLKSCLEKAPIIALVAYSNNELHYVTIVEITKTEVVINHDAGEDNKGNKIYQERVTHKKFLELLGFDNCTFVRKQIYAGWGCGKLTVIAQKVK